MFCMNLYLLVVSPVVFIHAALVHIDQGALNGTTLVSSNGNKYYGFYGIPYAQPPVDALRLQPPKLPPPSWSGIKDATKKPPSCPQSWFPKHYIGSEDCLSLQVFTRNINPAENVKLHPVLVFFPGGVFFVGGSNFYTGKRFLDKPIVMVIVDSRLGVFGYFSTGEPDYPGNYGLKDQIAALWWIRRNIRAFGGDPSAVTIMGHSSGSSCVQYHMMSPLSTGLFHRAILISGTGLYLRSYSSKKRVQKTFQDFKQRSNCVKPSTNESVACLLNLSAKELTELASTYQGVNANPFKMTPVIEPFDVAGSFLTSEPYEFKYIDPQIPLLLGYTSNEQLGISEKHKLNATYEETYDVLLSKELFFTSNTNPKWARNIINLIKQLYFQSNFSNINYDTTTYFLSDLRYKLAILETMKTYPGPTYAYKYDFRNFSLPTRDLGVGHREDLNLLINETVLNAAQKEVSETIITYWSNFVLTGDPNFPDTKLPIKWIPAKYKYSLDNHLRLIHVSNDGFRMKRVLPGKKLEFWTHYSKNRNRF